MAKHERKTDGVPPERQFYSIGFIAQQLNMPVHAVVSLALDTNVAPCYMLNGVAHFDGHALTRMCEHMALVCEYEADKLEKESATK